MITTFRNVKRKKRVFLFSQRKQLRSMNRTIAIATKLEDVAWLEELMEERYRLLDSLLNK